jgi:thiosulfate dehydrogenase [quinone] large subunit
MGNLALSRTQQTLLVLLRTLIGWHFVYEGFVKVWWPAWSRAGVPLGRWSSASYLRSSTGPFADVFRGLADGAWASWIDLLIPWGLMLVGLALMLGIYTQAACAAALFFLALFYLSWLPTRGLMEPGAEGNYLLVNKNLIEGTAVAVLLAFRTGRIAGLDLLRARARAAAEAPAAEETR